MFPLYAGEPSVKYTEVHSLIVRVLCLSTASAAGVRRAFLLYFVHRAQLPRAWVLSRRRKGRFTILSCPVSALKIASPTLAFCHENLTGRERERERPVYTCAATINLPVIVGGEKKIVDRRIAWRIYD